MEETLAEWGHRLLLLFLCVLFSAPLVDAFCRQTFHLASRKSALLLKDGIQQWTSVQEQHRLQMFGNALTWQWEVYLTLQRRFHFPKNIAASISKSNPVVFHSPTARHKNEVTGTLTLLRRSLLSSRGEAGCQTNNFPLSRWSFFPAVKAGSNQSIPTSTPMMPRGGAVRHALSVASYVTTRWQQSEGLNKSPLLNPTAGNDLIRLG